MTKGKVYLIGAGPGDPELITIRGQAILDSCEAVIYDNLVAGELIIGLRPEIEKYYVGKKAGKATLPQDEINALMVKLAGEGKNVARLKGGDPFVFGRGAEEAIYLKNHNIDFEVIPGVTAGVAAPAYAGIPCTERSQASYVIFATGHKAKEKDVTSVPWNQFAQLENGTIVVYMGVAEFANIVSIFIDNGMHPDTPAAVIERGTFPSQRVIVAPLNQLTVEAIENKIKPPSIFVIGNVVDHQEYLNWFDHRPLFGKRIMVCRPADRAKDMYKSLRDLGAEVLPYPTIATRISQNSDAWAELQRLIIKSPTNMWLVFTSENGVRYFIEQFKTNLGDIRKLAKFKIAAVGYGTARALETFSLQADFIPSEATTQKLASEMVEKLDLFGASIVRVRGNLADMRVEDTLSEAGTAVLPISVYETYFPEWPEGFKEKLFDYPPDVVVFTSGSTVEGLVKFLNEEEIEELMDEAVAISIGPSTTAIAKERGIKIKLEAKEHNIPGIIAELVKHYK